MTEFENPTSPCIYTFIGPPRSGKTTAIKHLVDRLKQKGIIERTICISHFEGKVYDEDVHVTWPQVRSLDKYIDQWRDGKTRALILDDADLNDLVLRHVLDMHRQLKLYVFIATQFMPFGGICALTDYAILFDKSDMQMLNLAFGRGFPSCHGPSGPDEALIVAIKSKEYATWAWVVPIDKHTVQAVVPTPASEHTVSAQTAQSLATQLEAELKAATVGYNELCDTLMPVINNADNDVNRDISNICNNATHVFCEGLRTRFEHNLNQMFEKYYAQVDKLFHHTAQH